MSEDTFWTFVGILLDLPAFSRLNFKISLSISDSLISGKVNRFTTDTFSRINLIFGWSLNFEMQITTQRRIQREYDTADAVSAPKLCGKKNNKRKTKACSNLKWLGSALSTFFSNLEVLNSKIFGPSVPNMGEGTLRDTKTSDFRYKRYPRKISRYVNATECVTELFTPEVATRDVLCKKVFLEISQNSQENTCPRVSFLIKLQASGFFSLLFKVYCKNRPALYSSYF